MRNKKNTKRAFTLLEIIVAIALLALLSSFMLTQTGALFSTKQKEIVKTFVTTTLETPLIAYSTNVGSYPSTEEGLMALIKAPESAASTWAGPYIKGKEVPKDPWGTPYQYKFPGEHNPNGYDIWSLGPDKKPSADDIGNWD